MKRSLIYFHVLFIIFFCTSCTQAQTKPYCTVNKRINQLFINEYIPAMERNGDIIKSSLPMREKVDFAPDGLRPQGMNTDELWNSSRIKLLFLLKDCNGHSDARDYEKVWGAFLHRISSLIYGFHNVAKNSYPPLNSITADMKYMAFNSYPHAYVNIKKKVGGARVSLSVIEDYAKKYRNYTLKEIDFLKPNVIICCGTFEVARDHLFNDSQMVKINENVFYCKRKKIIFIKSYHPAASVTNYELYDKILNNFIKAVNIISRKYNQFATIL